MKKEAPTFRVACAVSIGYAEVRKYLTALKDIAIVDLYGALQGDCGNRPCHGLVIYSSQFSTPVSNWIQKQPLEWIHLVTAGTEQLDSLPISEDVHVSSSGHLWSGTVAEHALGMLLTLCRGMDFSIRTVQTDRWSRNQIIPRLRRIKDLAVLIVGYGRIGSEIGRTLKSFGARVTGVASSRRTVNGVTVHELSDLDALIPEADVVIISLPLGPSTHHLISRVQFALMKKTLILINVSRGAVLDQTALYEVLNNGGISCAGLDVFESEPLPLHDPLRSLPNVLLTPHVAGFGERGIEEVIAANVRDNLQDILAGRMPRDQFHQNPTEHSKRQ